MTTELIIFNSEAARCEDPRFAVCYAKGSVFRPEGNFYKVQKGSRGVVHRSLCLVQYFGKRCVRCPNYKVKIRLEVLHDGE